MISSIILKTLWFQRTLKGSSTLLNIWMINYINKKVVVHSFFVHVTYITVPVLQDMVVLMSVSVQFLWGSSVGDLEAGENMGWRMLFSHNPYGIR